PRPAAARRRVRATRAAPSFGYAAKWQAAAGHRPPAAMATPVEAGPVAAALVAGRARWATGRAAADRAFRRWRAARPASRRRTRAAAAPTRAATAGAHARARGAIPARRPAPKSPVGAVAGLLPWWRFVAFVHDVIAPRRPAERVCAARCRPPPRPRNHPHFVS